MCADMQIQGYTRYTRRARLVEARIQILMYSLMTQGKPISSEKKKEVSPQDYRARKRQ